MTFLSILTGFIGRSVDVAVTGTVFFGTLTAVSTSVIEVQEPSGLYGPGPLLRIPTTNVNFVRILH
jgi:hypothetical protein